MTSRSVRPHDRRAGLRLAATAAVAAALGATLLGARAARAEGLALQLQPAYSFVHTTNTDSSGVTTESDAETVIQRYRLTLDRSLTPNLRLSAGGLYDWTMGAVRPEDGDRTDVDTQRWTGYARLSLGGPVLHGGAGYERREERSEARTAGVSLESPTLIHEVVSLSAGWAPADLPTLDLRASRTTDHDRARTVSDSVSDTVSAALQFDPTKDSIIRYGLSYGALDDRLRGVETTELRHAAQLSLANRFLDGRLSTFASYAFQARAAQTRVSSTGGSVRTLQFPVGGLSKIEAFPDVPTRVTLPANPALLDGSTTATAGLDLGFGRTLAGDTASRDLGAQFADETAPVDEIWVWVDRELPEDVAAAFTWTAYQSRDNLDWTEVPLSGGVEFGPFQNRFAIPVQRITARYVKVVVRPLGPAVTVDPQYREIVVTELQTYQVESAEAARGRSSSTGGTFNGTARYTILRVPALAYDASLFLAHASGRGDPTWTLSNGLSLAHRLNRAWAVNARAERIDAETGSGHEGTLRYNATLSVEPIPTAGGAVTASGQWVDATAGRSWSNSVGLLGHADPYEGITVFASALQDWSTTLERLHVATSTVTAGTTLVPNRMLSATASTSYRRRTGLASGSDEQGIVDGTVSFSPVPAFQASGSASRIFGTEEPSTLASWALGLSPFPGGALVLRYSHTETLDTGADLRTRTTGPTLRWNVRSGTYVQASYTLYDSRSPALHSSSEAFFADLLVTLR